MNPTRIKRRLGRWLEASGWRSDRRELYADDRSREPLPPGTDPGPHLDAAIAWLERCHEASTDGGFPGRYRLRSGWSASYPETTGYLVPTLLALAEIRDRPHLVEIAGRSVEFLLGLQTDEGAFPGGEVGSSGAPSVFNTAQILCGLDAWDAAQPDERVQEAAGRAADWLVRVQHDDGAWRDFTYGGLACAYYAHAACWLARFGDRLGEARWAEAALRNTEWVLSRQDTSTGWFDNAGFPRDHVRRIAETHTLGYTLWGLVQTSDALGIPEPADAARRAALAVAQVLDEHGWLPGRLDHRWHGQADYACLTGTAQMAQLWFRLAREGDATARLGRAADLALRLAMASQRLEAEIVDVRGGLAGSDPIWGDYLPNEFPNWAVKFLADAILEARPDRVAR